MKAETKRVKRVGWMVEGFDVEKQEWKRKLARTKEASSARDHNK